MKYSFKSNTAKNKNYFSTPHLIRSAVSLDLTITKSSVGILKNI